MIEKNYKEIQSHHGNKNPSTIIKLIKQKHDFSIGRNKNSDTGSKKHSIDELRPIKSDLPAFKHLEIKCQENENESNIFTRKQTRNKNIKQSDFNFKRFLRKNIKHVIDSISDEEDFEESSDKNSKTLIHPNSYFKLTLDVLITIISIYSIILDPLKFSFGEIDLMPLKICEIIFEIIFILDLITNFYIPYHNDEETLIYNKYLIFKNYLRGWFVSDLISSIPTYSILIFFEKYNNTSEMQYISKIALFLRWFKLIKIIKIFDIADLSKIRFLDELNITSGKVRFIEFIFGFLFISHLLTCFWIYLASLDKGKNWISQADLNFMNNFDIYIASLYFNWSSIFTIGYGDILSVNIYERIFNILIMLFGVLIYSFTVSCLGNIVSSYDNSTKIYMDNLHVLEEIRQKFPEIDILNNQDERDEKIIKEWSNESLYSKLSKYLTYQHKMNKQGKLNFMNELTINIKNELILKMYKEFMNKFSFFKNKNGEYMEFNSQIILKMRPLKVYKNEYIYKENEKVEEMFFVKHGMLSVETNSDFNNMHLFNLRKNDHYGIVNVLNNDKNELNIKVRSRTAELFIIKKQDLIKISTKFPKIFSKIFRTSSKNYLKMREIIDEKKFKFLLNKEKNSKIISNRNDSNSILIKPSPELSSLYKSIRQYSNILKEKKEEINILKSSKNLTSNIKNDISDDFSPSKLKELVLEDPNNIQKPKKSSCFYYTNKEESQDKTFMKSKVEDVNNTLFPSENLLDSNKNLLLVSKRYSDDENTLNEMKHVVETYENSKNNDSMIILNKMNLERSTRGKKNESEHLTQIENQSNPNIHYNDVVNYVILINNKNLSPDICQNQNNKSLDEKKNNPLPVFLGQRTLSKSKTFLAQKKEDEKNKLPSPEKSLFHLSTLRSNEKKETIISNSSKRNDFIIDKIEKSYESFKKDKQIHSKALLANISLNVKHSFKQNNFLIKSPKKFMRNELNNILKKHIEGEKRELNEIAKRLEVIHDKLLKFTLN